MIYLITLSVVLIAIGVAVCVAWVAYDVTSDKWTVLLIRVTAAVIGFGVEGLIIWTLIFLLKDIWRNQ